MQMLHEVDDDLSGLLGVLSALFPEDQVVSFRISTLKADSLPTTECKE